MDQFWPNPRDGGAPRNAIPVGTFRQGNGPTLERGVLNGDDLHFGQRRRRTRSSHSESQGSGQEEELMGESPVLHHAMQGEPIWYNRGAYEQAESNYHRRLAGTAAATTTNEPLSSSPRGSGTRGSNSSRTLTFRSKRPYGQQQDNWDQEHPSNANKLSPGPRRRQSSRGRNRSTSETEQGGKGSRGPPRRRRGYSETESRPRWDNTKMSGVECFATENIWFDKPRYDEAERRFYEGANGPSTQTVYQAKSALQAAKGRPKRQHRNSSSHGGGDQELISRMKSMELENQGLHKVVADMRAAMQRLESRVAVLEKSPKTSAPAAVPCAMSAPVQQVKVENGDDDDDDDDIDLFGSDDEEDAEAERLKQERIDAYAAKKAKKPALIAKSSILLDVKPWDDETDMVKLEECVRSVVADGLLWGASKLLPVGYGINKLQINCVVEDDKVGTDMLEEEITKFEDYVQSVDVAAFNKI